MNILEKAVLEFYAHNLIEKRELDIIKERFDELDFNGNGFLSYKKIKKSFVKMGIPSDTLKEAFKILDEDGNNIITFNEFIMAFINREDMKRDVNIQRYSDFKNIFNNFKFYTVSSALGFNIIFFKSSYAVDSIPNLVVEKSHESFTFDFISFS